MNYLRQELLSLLARWSCVYYREIERWESSGKNHPGLASPNLRTDEEWNYASTNYRISPQWPEAGNHARPGPPGVKYLIEKFG